MSTREPPIGIDRAAPPFDQFTHIRWLARDRSGHQTHDHVRHQLYVARPKGHPVDVLIKVMSKPGLVYEQNITNEIETLLIINRELPDSRHFPVVHAHGRLSDGRLFLVTSLFDEFPLATVVGTAWSGYKLVGHLRTAIAIAKVLTEIHRLEIFHVDLNPMNILYGTMFGAPVIRLIDFESSYARARYADGAFYSPPTTPGYSAPEIATQAPDARSDLFSLGAVLHTLLAGYRWTEQGDVAARVAADQDIDVELKETLLGAVDADPDKRFPSVQAFQDRLAAYLERIWPGRSW